MPMESPLSPLEIPEISLHQFILSAMETHGDKIAVINGLTDEKLTYNQLVDKIRRVASGLYKLGLRKGDIVAVFSPNSPEWIVMFFAVMAAGATVTTVNPAYTSYELTHNLRDSASKFVFTLESLHNLVSEAAEQSRCVENLIILSKTGGCGCGCVNFDDLVNDIGDAFPDVEINPQEDVAVIPYSSGTTGLPKGVMLTHFNFVANLTQLRHPEYDPPGPVTDGSPFSMVVAVLPYFHMSGMLAILIRSLLMGGTQIILPRYIPEQFLTVCEKYKVTRLPLVPPLIVALNKDDLMDKFDLSSVQAVTCGAAPLSKDTEEEFTKKLNLGALKQSYGMTEMTCVGIRFTLKAQGRPGACGYPIANSEIKIRDLATGRELGVNERGEILFRGPNVMKGYLNRPDATADTIDKDGWLHTGDIGYYDEDGYIFIVDRLKELIKYKGFQVAPAELEAVLLSHPMVADVGVIGIPDQEAGEIPKAYVMKKSGVVVTEAELKSFVAERLATFKHLKGGVQFVTSVPKSATGKILRRQLRDMNKQSKL